MKATELKHRPVVSLADGTRVGEVADVILECATLRLAGLTIETPNGPSAVRFESIKSIGEHAVTLEQGSSALEEPDRVRADGLRTFAQVKGLRVINADGSVLGELRDVDVAPEAGRVAGIEVHRGGIFGMGGSSQTIPASHLRSLGPDFVTADTPSAPPGDPTARAQ